MESDDQDSATVEEKIRRKSIALGRNTLMQIQSASRAFMLLAYLFSIMMQFMYTF